MNFDPASFQLPDQLQRSQGPTNLNPEPPNAHLQQVEHLLQRESKSPSDSAQVSQNLKQQLQIQASEQRTQQLKRMLTALKGPERPVPQRRELLLKVLKGVQNCYASSHAPKDLTTLQVLHPLLKVQAYKWDQLQAQAAFEVPPQEQGYLQKLRRLQGSGLGAIEKAALFQVILALNAVLESLPTESLPPEPPPAESPTPAPPELKTVEPTLPEDFEPLQAQRLLLQWRAKLQRTHSESEKVALHAQIQALSTQQALYFEQRQQQALNRQVREFESDLQRFRQARTLSRERFESWRKLRLTGLQGLMRLCGNSQSSEDAACGLLTAAQRLLARIGLSDVDEVWQRERLSCQSLLTQLAPVFEPWWQSFVALFETALNVAQQQQENQLHADLQAQLQSLQKAQSEWQVRRQELQTLEQQYLQTTQEAVQQSIKTQLLEGYAELLAQLPQTESKNP